MNFLRILETGWLIAGIVATIVGMYRIFTEGWGENKNYLLLIAAFICFLMYFYRRRFRQHHEEQQKQHKKTEE